MKILPPQIQPPRAPTLRRHAPSPAGRWTAYRECLRWDFGFTCPFCLLHEADFHGGLPGEGLGATTVEHWIPRQQDASLANDYGNCLYVCRFCNRARSAQPVATPAASLIDPTVETWSDHFQLDGDQLLPIDGDADAAYTHRTYELDDPRKALRRKIRRQLVSDRLLLLEELGGEITALHTLAASGRRADPEELRRVRGQIQHLMAEARRAFEDLERYRAIPIDAPEACRCRSDANHRLPDEIESQLVEIAETLAL